MEHSSSSSSSSTSTTIILLGAEAVDHDLLDEGAAIGRSSMSRLVEVVQESAE